MCACTQLTLHIYDYGASVEVEVQRKFSLQLRYAIDANRQPLFASGPRAACHMSGPQQFEASGKICLGRPVAQDGMHSYVSMGRLEEELDEKTLEERDELSMVDVGSHTIAVLDIYLQPFVEPTPRKRKAFTQSPPGLRHRPLTAERRTANLVEVGAYGDIHVDV